MIASDQKLLNSEKNLRYINEHKSAFEIEYLYPLDIFEKVVEEVGNCTIECSCKINKDKLYPARFNLAFHDQQYAHQAETVLDFFQRVETRVGTKLNYKLFKEFLKDFDFSKVTQVMTGIDLREEFSASRVKTWWSIQDYPEKIESVIALHGDSPELRALLVGNPLVVGFHLYLNGRSGVRLYPFIGRADLADVNVQMQLEKVSPTAGKLIMNDCCLGVSIALDKANQDKILHCHLMEGKADSFIDNLRNQIASRVHAHYRHQPVNSITVSFSEKELIAGTVSQINMYYMNA